MPCTINDFYEAAGSAVGGQNNPNAIVQNPGAVYLIPGVDYYFGSATGLIEVFEEVKRLQTGTASQTSFFTFMSNIWANYSNAPDQCNYLRTRYINFADSLVNNTYNTAQTLLRTAKRDYFQYMYYNCTCPVPPLNNVPPPLI